MSALGPLGPLVILKYYIILCKQTVETMIRRLVLWRLIWVCTVCLCPTKRTLCLYVGLTIVMRNIFYAQHSSTIVMLLTCSIPVVSMYFQSERETVWILIRLLFLKPADLGLLFDLILYVPSTIFQLNRGWSSWFEPVLS